MFGNKSIEMPLTIEALVAFTCNLLVLIMCHDTEAESF